MAMIMYPIISRSAIFCKSQASSLLSFKLVIQSLASYASLLEILIDFYEDLTPIFVVILAIIFSPIEELLLLYRLGSPK